jgi:hypothetical protein
MTPSQRAVFNQVKEFVLENRSASSSMLNGAELSFSNTFSAGERALLINLAHDLRLTLSWDGYDEEGQNIVVLRFPGALEPPSDDQDSEGDSQDEATAVAAVDFVLRKYNEAKTFVETAEDNFDSREELKLQCKVDNWKRTYYLV